MIGAYVEGIKQLNMIKADFFKKYEKYVTSYDVVFVVEGYTSQRTYLLSKKAFSKTMGGIMHDERIEIDKKDKKILHLIANNARFNYVDLAKNIFLKYKVCSMQNKKS